MIGSGYWATGIVCKWRPDASNRRPGWAGTLKFYDAGFCNDDPDAGAVSTQGELGTRYYVAADGTTRGGLPAMLDVLIADAGRLGISLRPPGGATPCLYVEQDGEDPDVPLPDGWQAMLREQATRLGWEAPYDAAPVESAS